ncbi:unnamed protein product [Protopolystoma xenopodis]|uniref:Uncharacterized protein n=1 Tax=Protopolystoma xenopodis TaxID=117903 RepID=A0A448X5G4_9PLAT|nr:unnamed protein product [Protopolystoma xenopodis]
MTSRPGPVSAPFAVCARNNSPSLSLCPQRVVYCLACRAAVPNAWALLRHLETQHSMRLYTMHPLSEEPANQNPTNEQEELGPYEAGEEKEEEENIDRQCGNNGNDGEEGIKKEEMIIRKREHSLVQDEKRTSHDLYEIDENPVSKKVLINA